MFLPGEIQGTMHMSTRSLTWRSFLRPGQSVFVRILYAINSHAAGLEKIATAAAPWLASANASSGPGQRAAPMIQPGLCGKLRPGAYS